MPLLACAPVLDGLSGWTAFAFAAFFLRPALATSVTLQQLGNTPDLSNTEVRLKYYTHYFPGGSLVEEYSQVDAAAEVLHHEDTAAAE